MTKSITLTLEVPEWVDEIKLKERVYDFVTELSRNQWQGSSRSAQGPGKMGLHREDYCQYNPAESRLPFNRIGPWVEPSPPVIDGLLITPRVLLFIGF